MKRAVSYCLQASNRFDAFPIMLIICIESLQESVKQKLRMREDVSCHKACSEFWADECYIMDKNTIREHINQDTELDPFVAFGLYMTYQAISVELTRRNTDPTIKMLYQISIDVYTKVLDQDIKYINELKELNSIYDAQYNNIINLLKDDNTSRSSIIDYVSKSVEFNRQQKRKPDELTTEDDHDTDRSKHQRAESSEQATTADYEEKMKFIEKFKEDRAKESKTMSWDLCLQEVKEKLNWTYKNSNSLRAAFAKYERKKQ